MTRALLALLIAATLAGCATTAPPGRSAVPVRPWTDAGDEWTELVRRTFEFQQLGVISVWWDEGDLLVVVDKGRRDGFERGLTVSISDSHGLRGAFELVMVDETTSVGRVMYPEVIGPWPS